jgi:hypothetical protein
MDRFDRKDPEIHFRELAQLKKTCLTKEFVTKFQKMAVMVIDIFY